MLAARTTIEGARVLDLFAGTGALALEALSRGADRAVLVEDAKPALAAIRENVSALGLTARVTVIAARVERALATVAGPFDLVFCDPPYALVRDPRFPRTLAALETAGLLAPGAFLVLEHDAKDRPPALACFEAPTTRGYGDTALSLFRHTSPAASDPERAE